MDLATLGVRVTTDGVSKAADDLDKMAAASDKAATSSEKLSATAAKAARSFDNSALSAQRIELAKLAGQIDPTIAKLDQLDKQQSKLAQFKKSGLLTADDFTALNSAIEANRARIASATESVHSFSLNNANARRELGYLAKDLATGQWGRFQQSFATLVSSSGLLATGFGGVAAAIAAAGAPFAAFAIAANDGSKVQNEFNAALAKTGDFVGVASGGMSKFASQVAGSNADLGKANDILIALAGNGKVSSDAFLSLGRAAMDVSKLTGDSAEKAAAAVTEMFDGTAASAVKANEQYHFLTLKVYEQIDALEKQGDAQRAAQVAADAFHDAIGPRLDEMNSQVTGLAKAWDDVKVAASGYWQEFKTGASLIAGTADMQTQIYDLMGKKEAAKSGNPFTFASWSPADETKLQDLQKQLSDKMTAAEAKAEAQRIQDAGVAGQSLLNKYTKQYESEEQKRQDALIDIHNAANKAIAAALAKGDTDMVNTIMAKEAAADMAARASWAKKSPSDDFDATILAKKQMTEAINKEIEGYKKELTQQAQNVVSIANYKSAMEESLRVKQKQIDLQIASIGMGAREAAQQRDILQVQDDTNKRIEQLNRDFADKGKAMTQETYDGELKIIKDAQDKRVQQIIDGNQRELAAMADWRNGARGAIADFEDSAANVAGQTHNLFTNAFDGMADSIAQFAVTGKSSFKDLADSILTDMLRIQARALESQALQAIFGSMYPAALAQMQANSFIDSVIANANGGVYDTASLSSFSGQIVDRPTMFAFAKGAGVMGEAGPEAILPLTRGANGKLGVQAAGGGGGDVYVSVENNGQAVNATASQTTGPNGDRFIKVILDAAEDRVASSVLRGGKVAKAHEHRYGIRQRGVGVAGA
ncbi:phage tail tape measure protein [Dyella sp. EPa41]|uniref:phage tail tape measure protein n=1 Tax=Dyella sp. EPa41 TaxID=1561194 RepID=UPI001915D629|nr:phage tail tape measure protein [Dyella sp. EPa41]